MARSGGCQCGEVRYRADGEPLHHALCHCGGCRASAGAPAVAWIAFPKDAVTVTQGSTTRFESSPGATREFWMPSASTRRVRLSAFGSIATVMRTVAGSVK